MTEPARRSPRARSFTIATLSALALTFQACGEDEAVYCVDELEQVVENENCYGDETDGDVDSFFWYYGSGLDVDKARKGVKLRGGERVPVSDFATIQSKGGFGGSARPTGIGRFSAGG